MKRYTPFKFEEAMYISDIFKKYGLDIKDAKKETKGKQDIYNFGVNTTLKFNKVHNLIKELNKLLDVEYSQIDADEGKIRINFKK
jgi:hypothetical protein